MRYSNFTNNTNVGHICIEALSHLRVIVRHGVGNLFAIRRA